MRKQFKPLKERTKIGNYIYFVEFRKEKVFAKGLTKKEYQKKWCKQKSSKTQASPSAWSHNNDKH